MTRFARSKGSKSSNERIPESSTPWETMKKQLEDKKKESEESNRKKEFDDKRKENYQNFLKEEEAKKITESWCEFENQTPLKTKKPTDVKTDKSEDMPKKKKKSKKKKSINREDNDSEAGSVIDVDDPELAAWCDNNSDHETEEKYNLLTTQLEELCQKEESDKKKKTTTVKCNDVSINDENIKVKKNRKRKLDSKLGSTASTTTNDENSIAEAICTDNRDEPAHPNKIKKLDKTNEESNVKSKKKKRNKKKAKTGNEESTVTPKSQPVITDSNKKKRHDKEHSRRKPVQSEKVILVVNGEELEVSTYDGFPILTKDAERLQLLRKSLISKGIPRSEVDRTLKLERRKAEKNLSRMKKKLCFHCRKGGHNLSECPELNKDADSTALPASGLCFKCGSTEHTHFACKVVRTQEYKFAQCFICKEQGHISRQCPDNPRGLYPKGGGCRECGDVTHLKKDCPKVMQKREDDTLRLETLQSENIEDIVQREKPKSIKQLEIKHVRF